MLNIRGDSIVQTWKQASPQLDVRATNAGVDTFARTSRPIRGAPSDPLKDDPDAETQRYLVDTVCDRKRWNKDTVEP
jgi:hypothetical protein